MTSLLLPITSIILYGCLSGEINSLLPYFRYSWEIASGYPDAMSRAGPFWQSALAFVTVGALLVGLPLIAREPRNLLPALGPAAITAFFLFKHAMVRQDPGHAAPFQIKIALAALFLLVCAKSRQDRRAIALFQTLTLLLGYHIIKEAHPGYFGRLETRFKLQHARTLLRQWESWPETQEKLRRRSESNLARHRLKEVFHAAVRYCQMLWMGEVRRRFPEPSIHP